MNIQFKNPGYEYSIQSILEFQKEDTTSFWNDSLFHFYQELDHDYLVSLSLQQRKEYLSTKFHDIYIVNEPLLNEKIEGYQAHWNHYNEQITRAFSDAFDMDCSSLFNDLVCNISLNPVSPRYLKEHIFDVFYLNSEKGALGNALHELVHFVWFRVWNQYFHDSYEEYEHPSLKWILSEMVVETILSDSRLSSINPYYPREHGGCMYPYFFTMVINGTPITDTLNKLYQKHNIQDFMRESYRYCQANEQAIRAHIAESEG